jgi:hypothetical protein
MGSPGKSTLGSAQPAGWDDKWHIVTARRNGKNADLRVDGATISNSTTMSSDADTNSSQQLMVCKDPFGNNFTGEIAELIIYRGALTDSDQSAVETYLANKYKLAGAAPSNK